MKMFSPETENRAQCLKVSMLNEKPIGGACKSRSNLGVMPSQSWEGPLVAENIPFHISPDEKDNFIDVRFVFAFTRCCPRAVPGMPRVDVMELPHSENGGGWDRKQQF